MAEMKSLFNKKYFNCLVLVFLFLSVSEKLKSQNCQLVVRDSVINATCDSSDGIIILSPYGTAPFTYSINGGAYFTSNYFYGLPNGTYLIYITDANGCVTTTSVTIVKNNYWTGAVSNNWEDPGNWSCGTVPDNNTIAVISSGTIVVNADTTIYSLSLSSNASFTVAPGVHLTILH